MSRRANGEGTFVLLSNGKILYKKYVGLTAEGKPKYLSVTADTKSECIKRMRTKVDECEKSKLIAKNIKKELLATLCERHLADDMGRKDKLKPKSADRRECTIRNQIGAYTIGKMQVQSVTADDIDKHIEGLIAEGRLSASSIKKTLDIINSAYNWAKKHKLVIDNPCDTVLANLRKRIEMLETIEADDADVIVLSDVEIKKLEAIKEIKNKNNGEIKYPIIYFLLILLYTGMRVGELCALRWNDYHASFGTLTINKTRYVAKNRRDVKEEGYRAEEGKVKNMKSREIVLTDEAKKLFDELYLLQDKPDGAGYILLNRKGRPSNPSKMDGCLRTIYKAASLSSEISGAHILRRTCATKFYEGGSSIMEIASYLGDTEETIKKHYVAVRKKMIEGGVTKNVVPVPGKRGK